MRPTNHGGGWQAIRYTLRKAREVGGLLKLYRAMRSKNACKTCALGMGGQQGGMVNELGRFPEVCKKSLQAMAADMQGAIQPEFWSTYSIQQLRRFSPRELETCGRLTQPVLWEQGSDYYRPIEWDDVLARIAAKLGTLTPDETFWYFSGRSSNEAGFLLQLFARVLGTNNVNNCSYYCHQASGVGLTSVLGTGTATLQLEDIEHADLVFVIGGNPPSNHPRLMTTLMNLRRRGGQCIVVNPVIEPGLLNFRVPSSPLSMLLGSPISSLYVQPHIGGDLAMLCGIGKRLIETGKVDEAFLTEHCTGWPELKAHLESLDWEDIVARSGVARGEIDEMAARYAASRNTVFSWTMGITHHAHGVHNVEMIAALALMRGMVGRPHCGLLPIRGHSNVQGIGSMGVTPKLRDAIFKRLEQHYRLQLPTTPGLDTMGCMDGAHEERLKFALCLGGNLYGSNPDAEYAGDALRRLETIVYLNTTLNTGHAHGTAAETIILPMLARDEEPEPTTQESMFNFVRLSDGGPRRHVGPRSEVEVIADLAHRVLGDGGPIDWRAMARTRQIREAIAQVVPGFEALADIDRTKQEFQIVGRTFHQPRFATPDGKARLMVSELPELAGGDGELRLMTVRSEGQFNTVVYEETDIYRGQDRRDVVLLHPDDLRRLNLADNQRVTVSSNTGRMEQIIARSFERIRPGNALMYYPEANVLVSRQLDPRSKTPAFKGVLIRVEASQAGTPRTATVAAAANGPDSEHRGHHDKLKSC